MDLDHCAVLLDELAHRPAGARVRRDGSAYGDSAVLGDLAGDEAYAPNIEIPVGFGEAELAGKIETHDVAIRRVAGRLSSSMNFPYMMRARVDLPEPDRPVKNRVIP